MNEPDELDPLFAALRAQPVPAELPARVRRRVLAGGSAGRRPRRILVAAAVLLALCGIGIAAAVHWWTVRIDTRTRRVEGGEVRRYYQDEFGNPWAEIELPDGRRVQVQLPREGPGERRVEVELPGVEAPNPR